MQWTVFLPWWKPLDSCRSIFVKTNDHPPSDAACSSWVLTCKFRRHSLSSGRDDSYPHLAPGGRKNLPSPMLEHLLHCIWGACACEQRWQTVCVLALWGDLRLQTLPYPISFVLLGLSDLSFSCVVNMEVCEEVLNAKNEVLNKYDLSSNKGSRR